MAQEATPATPANGNGIIRTLPVTEDFENGTGIFTGGENFDHTSSLGKILRVYSDANNSAFSKATASFDVNEVTEGNQAYVLKSNEKVTISYTAFHGWLSKGKAATFSILNSDGKAIVSYTYDYNSCNITNLLIGGTSVSGFSAFACQSTRYNNIGSGADGLDKNWYSTQEGYNPQITITISGNGLVTISFQKTIGTGKQEKFSKTFSASLPNDVANNLGSIVIENASNTNAGRAYAIDNLSIKTETSAETTASYTVKKVCGSQVLSTETSVGVVGTTPVLTGENIFVGDKKYIYVGNDAESVGAIGSETVYTLNYREAASYNYSVVGKIGDETVLNIANGTNFEGETVTAPYLRYVLKDGKWYEATKGTAGYYLASAELTQDNQEIAVNYSSKDLANITYFKEAEEIEGLTVSTNQNADVRCSNGAGAYNSSEEPVVVTTLPAGTYKLTIGLWGGKNDKSQNFKLNCGDEWTVPFTGSFQDVSQEITLDKETTISIPKSDAANGRCLDYVMIQTLGNNVAITSVKYATYVPTCNVVAPADVKVYTAKADVANKVVNLTEIPAGSVISAGTPVLVGAAAGTYTFAASADEPTTIGENDLKAATAETKGNGSIYVLVEQNNQAVFAPVKEGVEVPVGKAYMEINAANKAAFYSIGGGNGTTSINNVNAKTADDGAYYTLQGVKVNKPAAKGIYIHNGKKVIK